MAKRKHTAALFEVMSKDKSAQGEKPHVEMPSWMGRAQTGPVQPKPTQPRPTAKPLRQPPGLGQTAPAGGEVREPIVSVAPGRIQLSLNYFSGIVVCLGLLVVLAGVYKLGQMSGRGQVNASAANNDIMDTKTTKPPVQPFDSASLQLQERWLSHAPGNYAVLQQAIASEQDAKAIQKYLWENGIDTAIVPAGTDTVIVDLRPYMGESDTALRQRWRNCAELGGKPNWALRNKYNLTGQKLVKVD